MRILSAQPGTEALGYAVLAFTEHMKAEEMQGVLGKHGFADVKPDNWYPMSQLLNFLNDIASTRINTTMNYVSIGMKRSETAAMPPHAANWTYADFLMNWDAVYQAQHRGGDVGHIVTKKINDAKYQIHFDVVYPDDFVYGVAWGFAKRFLPTSFRFVMEYDQDTTRKDLGGDITILNISWHKA